MTVLGPRAAIDIAVPTGVDGSEIYRFSRMDGISPQTIIAEAAVAIGVENEALVARYGGLISITPQMHAIYRQGSTTRSETPKRVQFASPDPVRSTEIGHMLPLDGYEDILGWTEETLTATPLVQLQGDIMEIRDRWRNRVDKDILTRALTNTENQIGASGYDVPWAIGTGVNVPYVPPQYMGNVFTSAHTHFVTKDANLSAANLVLLLNDMVSQLRHHGHSGRLVALVSDADISYYQSMTDFTKLVPFDVIMTPQAAGNSPVQVTRGEVQGIPGELFGYFNSTRGVVELRYHERIPTGYAFMTKSYGVNDSRNGLAIRIPQNGAFGLSPNPQLNNDLVRKLRTIAFLADHGVGVNERTNGVAGLCASGATSWVNPTL